LKISTKKIALSGLLIALGIAAGSFLYIPVGVSKVYPVQHFVNVAGAVILGPYYAVINAFLISLVRNMMGTGTLLAYPGSMIGALLAGLLFKKFKSTYAAAAGELVGTGLLGAVLCYPVAALLMGRDAALFLFVVPFSMSSLAGVVIALAFLNLPVIKRYIKNIPEGE
jgi:energy coupling factor transporter S component ThiW